MSGNRRDSANGSSPIFRRRSDSQSDRENRNADDMSIGSSASDEIQTDFAEVDNECEPDTVDNCFPDEILYRRLDEPGPSSSRDGRRKYREKMVLIMFTFTYLIVLMCIKYLQYFYIIKVNI